MEEQRTERESSEPKKRKGEKVQCDQCRHGARVVIVSVQGKVGRTYGRNKITIRDGIVYELIDCRKCGERFQQIATINPPSKNSFPTT